MGMWVPVHDDGWDGNKPVDSHEPVVDSDSGCVVFRAGALPWKAGKYEVSPVFVMIRPSRQLFNRYDIIMTASITLWPLMAQ
jgi:hypothetical protein